jgi:hypothetical protein
MIPPHPRLQVHIAEQLATPIVTAAHPIAPRISPEPVNHAPCAAATGFFNSLLVLLCHEVPMATGTSWEALCEGVGEFDADGSDRIDDVALRTEWRRRGVDNLRVAEAL